MDGQDIGGPSFQYRSPLEGVNRREGDGVIAPCLWEAEPQLKHRPQINRQYTSSVTLTCPQTYITTQASRGLDIWPLYMECCASTSLAEIRSNPFNYPPEPGPAFITTTALLVHLSDSLLQQSEHVSIFFACIPFTPVCCSSGVLIPSDYVSPLGRQLSHATYGPVFSFATHQSTAGSES